MKRIIVISVFCFSIGLQPLIGQEVGNPIPDSGIETVLQSSVSSINSLGDMKGKWLLLEFWGTWCAPCISKIPSLNKMQEELNEENIQFISITWEDQEKVERFLKRKPINGWIGIDKDRSLIDTLNVRIWPTTLLVDAEGIIRSRWTSEKLNSSMILEFMKNDSGDDVPSDSRNKPSTMEQRIGEAIKINSSSNTSLSLNGSAKVKSNNGDQKSEAKPIYSVSIQPSDYESEMGMFAKQAGRLRVKGLVLSKLISEAYGVSQFQVVGEQDLLERRFDVDVKLPGKQTDTFEKVLQSAIERSLKYSVAEKNQSIKVLRLTAPNGPGKHLYASKTERWKFSWDDGNMAGTGLPIEGQFLKGIGSILGMEILNETALEGKYDFNLFWDEENPASVKAALKEQLGLVLIEKEEEMKVLLVTED